MEEVFTKVFVGWSNHINFSSSAETATDCGNCDGGRCEGCKRVYAFEMQEIASISIENFAEFLHSSAAKWRDVDWVKAQYSHYVDECRELRASKDQHLQAEMLDMVIISACLSLFPEEGGERLEASIDSLGKEIEANGVVEAKDFSELFEMRADKFLSKLHL